MTKRENIERMTSFAAGNVLEPVKLQYFEAENGNDLLIKGEFTPKRIKLIESGRIKVSADLSQLSTEMLKRIKNGHQPKVFIYY